MGAVHQIGHADGIGHGDDDEAGAQQLLLVGPTQHRQEVVEQHGARLLVGMERGLQVDLLGRGSRADAVERQFNRAAGRVALEQQGIALEGHQRRIRWKENRIGIAPGK
jgi:hypothetical protein